MDIRQLRYFIAIVEQGSFSRAAALLHIAQPALSLHVRNMESDLKTPLLFRTPKGVIPTEAGEILLRNARIILDQMTIAEEEIRGSRNDPAGEVRLGLPGTISQILSVPLITAVHKRHPKIKLRIAEAMSGFVLEWMREAKVDLAVIYSHVTDDGLTTDRLLSEELALFGPPGHPLESGLASPGEEVGYAQAASLPLILPETAHGLRELLERQAAASGLTLNVAVEVGSYSNIKELAASGFGYSILPINAIAREVAAGELRSWRIRDPAIWRSVHLARSVERPMTNAVAVVHALTQEVLRDLARTGRWAGARPLAAEGL